MNLLRQRGLIHDWTYDKGEVRLLPQVLGNRFVYCVKKTLTLVDLTNGSQRWQAEEADRAGFFFAPDASYPFSVDDEDIAGYDMR